MLKLWSVKHFIGAPQYLGVVDGQTIVDRVSEISPRVSKLKF